MLAALLARTAAAAPSSMRRTLCEAFAAGDPHFDARRRVRGGFETGAEHLLAGQRQSGQDVVAAAVGDDDFDALAGHA